MNSDLLCFIPDDDGYSEEVYFAAVARIHPEVRFTYRPTRVMERVDTQEQIRTKTVKQAEFIQAHAVACKILKWSIKGRNGEVASISADFILSLKSPLYRRICSVVFYGTEAGDIDPGKPSDEELLKSERDAVLLGLEKAVFDRGN